MSTLFKDMERIEEARSRMMGSSFMGGLFMGRPSFELLLPTEETAEEREIGERYCATIADFLQREVDPDEIEQTAKIPEKVLKGLFDLGAFGMKIPKEYGGLGFSYTNYGRVLTVIASWSNSLALTVAVPQSIGIAMPILLFGNEEQKKTYLPRVAREDISAFALTEPITGSDAANIETEAALDPTGTAFITNGQKLWCTNGPIARYVTLVALVPARRVSRDGRNVWVPVSDGSHADDRVHSTFVLDMETAGVTVRQRCQFEGCRGIENAHLTLTNVRIPADNLIGEVGQGLKYALTILNMGRAISIPAICLGMAKQAWQPSLDWANTRTTFNKPIGERQTQRIRIGDMAVSLFAMEALSLLVWRMADQKAYDIRIEAAIAKIFTSERTIRFLKDAQTIFGGMGYERADSKRFRGEPGFPVEQLVRDAEMYRIGEGATDILRPFVSREGLNPHLERAQGYFGERVSTMKRIGELLKLARFYLPWYLTLWARRPLPQRQEMPHSKVRDKLKYIERASRRLARAILYAMTMHQEALRDDQGRQNRIEAVAEDLLSIGATALYAEALGRASSQTRAWDLADEFYRTARARIRANTRAIIRNQDGFLTSIGKCALHGDYGFLSAGIIRRTLNDYLPKEKR